MSFLSNIKLPWQKNDADSMDKWPEMVMIKREFFEDLIKKEVVCRFIQDMNQGMNGTLHLPASWLIEARPEIAEMCEKILEHLDANATPINEKMKILGLKIVDGKMEEVKA